MLNGFRVFTPDHGFGDQLLQTRARACRQRTSGKRHDALQFGIQRRLSQQFAGVAQLLPQCFQKACGVGAKNDPVVAG